MKNEKKVPYKITCTMIDFSNGERRQREIGVPVVEIDKDDCLKIYATSYNPSISSPEI